MLFSEGQEHFKQNAPKNIKQSTSQIQKNKSVVNNSIPPKIKHPTGQLIQPREFVEEKDEEETWDILTLDSSEEENINKNINKKIPAQEKTLMALKTSKLSSGIQKPLNKPILQEPKKNENTDKQKEEKNEKDFDVLRFSLSNKDIEKIGIRNQEEAEKRAKEPSRGISKPQIRKKGFENKNNEKDKENILVLGKIPIPKPKLEILEENNFISDLTIDEIENTISILKKVLENYA